MFSYILSFFLGFIVLVGLSAAFAAIKMVIHNFLDYGYFQHLWLKYTIFYTIVFGIRVVFSLLISNAFAYTWPILLLIIIAELLLFYKKYYILESKMKYFIFVLSSSVFGAMLITVILGLAIVTFAVVL